MTSRSRDGTFSSATSETFSPLFSPGSVSFFKPSEVDHWCHSLPVQLPLTPDSGLDGTFSDFCQDFGPDASLDMSAPYEWAQAAGSDNMWATTSAPEEISSVASAAAGWTNGLDLPVDEPLAESAAWLPATHGSVAGLSPVLSQMSQNSHGLQFLPEDCYMPFGDQNLLAGDSNQWTASDPFPLPIGAFPGDALAMDGVDLGPQGSRPADAAVQQHSLLPAEAQSTDPQRSLSDSGLSQSRPFLACTYQALPLSRSQSGPQPFATPPQQLTRTDSMTTHVMVGDYSSALSTVEIQSPLSDVSAFSPVGLGPHMRAHAAQPRSMAPDIFQHPSQQLEFGSMPYFEFLEQPLSPRDIYDVGMPCAVDDALLPLDNVYAYAPFDSPPADAVVEAGAADGDEGRYRTDPLYQVGPQADGLYHCFNEGSRHTPCSHKPTKLKCNYDKYIDSHLKPFRCKDAACVRQHFSSMACVLRHEREAHGLHGHGDRPFPCRYIGCDRAQPRNGFPRKYNLCDHMRRVHGWRAGDEGDGEDDPKALKCTPALPGGRKRRTSTVAPSAKKARKNSAPPAQ